MKLTKLFVIALIGLGLSACASTDSGEDLAEDGMVSEQAINDEGLQEDTLAEENTDEQSMVDESMSTEEPALAEDTSLGASSSGLGH